MPDMLTIGQGGQSIDEYLHRLIVNIDACLTGIKPLHNVKTIATTHFTPVSMSDSKNPRLTPLILGLNVLNIDRPQVSITDGSLDCDGVPSHQRCRYPSARCGALSHVSTRNHYWINQAPERLFER